MMTANGPLAGFEERRLVELKEHIITRAASERARKQPRRRLVLAGAAAVGICAATTVTVVSAGSTEPAYAVTKDSDGIVYVKIRDFRNAGRLTKQLEDLGVPAIVNYAPPGTWCREPRGTYVTDVPAGLYHAPTNIPGEEHGSGWQMQINTRLFKPGQTFVWTMTAFPDGGSSTSTILINGPVAPCVLVPDERFREMHNPPASGSTP